MQEKSSYEEDDEDYVLQSEVVLQSEIRQEDDTNKIENQSDLQEINNDIVQNDIIWGHNTLKKFFSSLRLL